MFCIDKWPFILQFEVPGRPLGAGKDVGSNPLGFNLTKPIEIRVLPPVRFKYIMKVLQ